MSIYTGQVLAIKHLCIHNRNPPKSGLWTELLTAQSKPWLEPSDEFLLWSFWAFLLNFNCAPAGKIVLPFSCLQIGCLLWSEVSHPNIHCSPNAYSVFPLTSLIPGDASLILNGPAGHEKPKILSVSYKPLCYNDINTVSEFEWAAGNRCNAFLYFCKPPADDTLKLHGIVQLTFLL